MNLILSQEIVVDYFLKNFNLSYSYNNKHNNAILSLIEIALPEQYELKKYIDPTPSFIKYKEFNCPIFGKTDKTIDLNKINFDIFISSFILLSGYQEVISKELDDHKRFLFVNSIQNKHDFIQTPVINLYFEMLYEKALKHNIKIEKREFDSPIVFTHDIDQLRSGWFEDLKYSLVNLKLKSIPTIIHSLFTKLFSLEDNYVKGLKKMMEIEKKHNINSISFIMSKKSHQDADYNLNTPKISRLIKSIKGELGFHPGYNTSTDFHEFELQKNKLEQFLGLKIKSVRQHFLQYNVNSTPKIHEKLNIEQDFSLGFVEVYGFRNSICTPFYLFDFENKRCFNTLQIPLFFMDSTLTDYQKNNCVDSRSEVIEKIDKIITNFNSHFSVLFHNSAFTGKKYFGYSEMYISLIKISKK